VDPDAQGRGIGRALMADALETLAARGWRHAVLWVLADNAHARRFYERGGWVDEGPFDHAAEGPAGPIRIPAHRYVKHVHDVT
jgi:ribosomal protein S18 acetylase RimI-like enzyme